MDEPICRLCLRTTTNNFTMTDDLRAAFDNLILKSVLNASGQQNTFCTQCRNNLQFFCDIKRACAVIGDGKNCSSVGTMDQEDTENKFLNLVVKNPITCNFCKKIVENVCFVSLIELKKNTSLVNILEKCNPELNFNGSAKFLSCESCQNSIQGLQSFIMNYFDVEEKVQKYVEMEGTDDNGKIDLKKVQEFKPMLFPDTGRCGAFKIETTNENLGSTFKPTLCHDTRSCSTFKTEAIDENQELFVIKSEPELNCENDLEPNIKQEEVDIKSEVDESDDESTENMEQPPSMSYHKRTSPDGVDVPMHKSHECTYGAKLSNHHMITNEDPSVKKKYKCEDCAYETEFNKALKRHMKIHKDPSYMTLHKCEICTYKTIRRGSLKKHVLTHIDPSEREKFKCNDCLFETFTKDCMKRHTLTHKDPSTMTVLKCKICEYETIYTGNMTRHMSIHKDPAERRKYKCKDCPYEAIDRDTMKRHTVTHKDPLTILMHKCEVCPYETIYAEYLARHLLKHKDRSQRKKYKCKDCEYETLHFNCMKRHILYHKDPSEVTIHRCELCAYETKYIGDFKKHMKIHEDSSGKRKGKHKTT